MIAFDSENYKTETLQKRTMNEHKPFEVRYQVHKWACEFLDQRFQDDKFAGHSTPMNAMMETSVSTDELNAVETW